MNEIFTEDEKNLFVQNSSKMRRYFRQEIINFYATHPDVFKSIVSGIYYRTSLPYSTIKKLDVAVQRFTKNFFMSSSGMEGISHSDQKALVDSNVSLVTALSQSVFLSKFSSLHCMITKSIYRPLCRC